MFLKSCNEREQSFPLHEVGVFESIPMNRKNRILSDKSDHRARNRTFSHINQNRDCTQFDTDCNYMPFECFLRKSILLSSIEIGSLILGSQYFLFAIITAISVALLKLKCVIHTCKITVSHNKAGR